MYQGAFDVGNILQRCVEESPDDAMSSHAVQEVSGVITQDVLNPVGDGEIRTQTQLSQVADAIVISIRPVVAAATRRLFQ